MKLWTILKLTKEIKEKISQDKQQVLFQTHPDPTHNVVTSISLCYWMHQFDSVCIHDYTKCNEQILMNFFTWIGPTKRRSDQNFGKDQYLCG